MLLRAGLVSFALLLASRLLGLLRESVQAATLGAGSAADAAILMLTLPDLLTGVLAAGGLAYVLLPLWARQTPAAQAQSQRRVAQLLLAVGTAAALAVLLLPGLASRPLAPGLHGADPGLAHAALRWSALCLPLALLAALWNTRLQHRCDRVGAYGASLWVNGAVVLALWSAGRWPTAWVETLGGGLLLGMLARLLWLRWRLRRSAAPTDTPTPTPAQPHSPAANDAVPPAPVWLWALASAALPLLLPLVARSLASAGGEGALTRFHYAWKLVELPLVLAVQLVAMLSLPRLARAWADPAADARGARTEALRHAFVLAWVLACAAAAALAGLAPALAHLLLGWGRMPPDAVAQVAHGARIGAWSLLPQALLAVLMTLLASTGRLRQAVAAYALALLVLLAGTAWAAHGGLPGGAGVMVALNAALLAAALWLLRSERQRARPALCARDLLPAALAALAAAAVGARWGVEDRWGGLLQALLLAGSVLGVAWLASPGWRAALRR